MKYLNKFRRFLALFFVAILLSSCTTTAKFSSAKTIDIKASIVQKPTVADLVVNETKVRGVFSGKSMNTPVEAIKNEAVAVALKTVSADVLVEPLFETDYNGSTTTVTVSGFPATFKNFRPIKSEDIPLLQSGVVRQVNSFVPPVLAPAKSSSAGKGLLITLGIVAAGIGLALALTSEK